MGKIFGAVIVVLVIIGIGWVIRSTTKSNTGEEAREMVLALCEEEFEDFQTYRGLYIDLAEFAHLRVFDDSYVRQPTGNFSLRGARYEDTFYQEDYTIDLLLVMAQEAERRGYADQSKQLLELAEDGVYITGG